MALLTDDESERIWLAVRGGRPAPLKRLRESRWRSHLTPEDVRAIRQSDASQATLATRYGVNRRTIGAIRRRETWGWVE